MLSQCCSAEPLCTLSILFSVISNMVATRHCAPEHLVVTRMTKKLAFKFYFILMSLNIKSHMWLMVTELLSLVLNYL
jgi:hypothetical protein